MYTSMCQRRHFHVSSPLHADSPYDLEVLELEVEAQERVGNVRSQSELVEEMRWSEEGRCEWAYGVSVSERASIRVRVGLVFSTRTTVSCGAGQGCGCLVCVLGVGDISSCCCCSRRV